MVRIKHYVGTSGDAIDKGSFTSLVDYLSVSNQSREDLLDYRFFRDSDLTDEIDQSDLNFLDIDSGTVFVTRKSDAPETQAVWIQIAIAVVVALITVALAPKPKKPGNRSQSSATNRLGASTNEARVNERIEDIFGTVTKHTPSLWQLPYSIGVNNQEAEVLLLCIGRGKYQMWPHEIFDGDTRLIDIPNAQFSAYNPGDFPLPGSLPNPQTQIGDNISEQIGIYRESNDLNPAELLPPNELDGFGLRWTVTGGPFPGAPATIITMTASNIPDGFVVADNYKVGSVVNMNHVFHFVPSGTVRLYHEQDEFGSDHSTYHDYSKKAAPVSLGYDSNGPVDYTVSSVSGNTVHLNLPVGIDNSLAVHWSLVIGYEIPTWMYFATTGGANYYISDEYSPTGVNRGRYLDAALTIPVNFTTLTYPATINQFTTGSIGPFVIPEGSDEIVLNFTSPDGFYNYYKDKKVSVTVALKVTIEELDSIGSVTGNANVTEHNYSSNVFTGKSVFQTVRLSVPYENSRVSVTRLTGRDKSSNTSNVDVVKWRDLYSFTGITNDELNAFGDVTLAHVIIPSNSQSQLVKQRKQNLTLTRKITLFDEDTGTLGPPEDFATDSFGYILIHMALDPHIGRLQLENINADGIARIYYDEMYSYWGANASKMERFGYVFDDSQTTFQDAFIMVCNVVNCVPYVQNGMYDAYFEKPQSVSGYQITSRNKVFGSETRSEEFLREYDGVEVSYRSEVTASSETIYLPSDRSATRPNTVELSGCVGELQAFRYALRLYNKQRYSRVKVSFDVDSFGRNLIPGKRIDSPDSTRYSKFADEATGYKVYQGEVLNVASNGVITISEPVVFYSGSNFQVVFTNEDGSLTTPVLCLGYNPGNSFNVEVFKIILSQPPSGLLNSLYDGYKRDRTKYTIIRPQERELTALIPQTLEFRADSNGEEIITVESILYNDLYYSGDLTYP